MKATQHENPLNHAGRPKRVRLFAKEPPSSGSERRLVLPRRETLKSKALSMHLDSIHHNTDDAIHKGYCKRNSRKLDAALANIITSAEAARELLRQND